MNDAHPAADLIRGLAGQEVPDQVRDATHG
ncbi:hypothetical protein FIU85_12900 [Roseovarius sp. THAF8]|nr:hypothetical protein FIU85_12900 [Roseovarius sp. THAF8]